MKIVNIADFLSRNVGENHAKDRRTLTQEAESRHNCLHVPIELPMQQSQQDLELSQSESNLRLSLQPCLP